ncbi:divalent-cation tolerance protein CutA [Methylobacillus flagellatus]|uniref:CutA1 divalent ion tolerance protein n=1 Tax=Methylobacillus flagellatus (strain ATCC 51484 / DSM 6875 / VKM B-1610 / KT) TaxID=265072 RepID=Q1GX96_METFK|nr:divalent-cation tolerance protein CutA [Methylobacillus flagellatus]ABE48300.1 CutA1 divalent ion tolerance protein [Methylobacillus flagellatus KT]
MKNQSPIIENSDAILVLTNLPDQHSAANIARELISRKLAACVNLLAPCQSVYQWQGKMETATEIPLLIKTTSLRYPQLEQVIRELHPYELPEIIHVPVTGGLPAYLTWLHEETRD